MDSDQEVAEEPRVTDVDVSAAAWSADKWQGLKTRTRAMAGDVAAELRARMSGDWKPLFAFDTLRADQLDQVIAIDNAHRPPGDVWFLGDIHGDLLALEYALWHINCSDPSGQATVVLLGDLIDDGGDAHEVVARVMRLLLDHPGKYCFLPGNHDESLSFDSAANRYTSSVDPRDYADFLNGPQADRATAAVAGAFIELVARSPRAVFFPDGLLAAHAGVPQRDLWESLTEKASFSQPLCLQDFVWTRAHPRARLQSPDRTGRGAHFGRVDFEEFCALATRVLRQPVERMIRGHDHELERWDAFKNYKTNRILTINTLSRRLPREWDGSAGRSPCIARAVNGRLPDVYRLMIPEHIVLTAFPALTETEEPEIKEGA